VIFFCRVPFTFEAYFNLDNMTGKTEIKVQGLLDKKWKNWFPGMDITYAEGNTIISGYIRDESFLHGILNKIRDLNLVLISVYSAE
jgi:hypothetical protein